MDWNTAWPKHQQMMKIGAVLYVSVKESMQQVVSIDRSKGCRSGYGSNQERGGSEARKSTD